MSSDFTEGRLHILTSLLLQIISYTRRKWLKNTFELYLHLEFLFTLDKKLISKSDEMILSNFVDTQRAKNLLKATLMLVDFKL